MSQDKQKFLRGTDIRNTRYKIPAAIPENKCEHCHQPEVEIYKNSFDENWYKVDGTLVLAKKALLETVESQSALVLCGDGEYFRFLDLPAEIRNAVYELVARRPKQPVCVPDRLLRPSEEMDLAKGCLRQCSVEVC